MTTLQMKKENAVDHYFSCILLIILVFSVSYAVNNLSSSATNYLRGLFSYLTFGLAFSLVALIIPKSLKWVSGLFLVFFLVFNTTHIYVNGSHMNLEYFSLILKSSFTASVFNQDFFIYCLYIFTGWLSAMWLSRLIPWKVNLKIALLLAVSFLVFDFLIPTNISQSLWSQQSFFTTNLRNLFSQLKAPKDSLESANRVSLSLKQDLSGEKFISSPINKTPNIVVLILEGLSQAHIDLNLAPQIKKIQDSGITARNFISHQMQTNRGLYSLFCADLPNLISYEAKSDLMASDLLKQKCLPHALKEIGYKNYFLQSAHLSFMRKDLFAKKAGFHFAVGAESFEQEKIISSWGISDKDLIEATFKVLVNKDKEPKFISSLTSGTHHPYVTPLSSGSLPHAITYTDHVVGKFYEALKEKGLLENTLLIITSDESKMTSRKYPEVFSNWGLLTVVGAGLKKQTIKQTFSQMDLTNSILDFIDVAENYAFNGRSIFRRYKDTPNYFMANTYEKRVFMTLDDGSFLLCDYNFNCIKKKGMKGLFSKRYSIEKTESSDISNLRYFVTQNDYSFKKVGSQILFLEENIKIPPKQYVPILEEFKTTKNVNSNLMYVVDMEEELEVALLSSFYPCGRPERIVKKTLIANKRESVHQLKVPLQLQKENLCHSLVLENKRNQMIKINKISLQK